MWVNWSIFPRFIATVESCRVSTVTNSPTKHVEILALFFFLVTQKTNVLGNYHVSSHDRRVPTSSGVMRDQRLFSNHARQNRLEIITLVKQLRHKESYKFADDQSRADENVLFLSADRFAKRIFPSNFYWFSFLFLSFSFHVCLAKKQIHESQVIVSRK